MVTCIAVDENYDFPCSELAAMAKNITRLIEDIDRLDINRQNMMEELKVLRDVTLCYNEQQLAEKKNEQHPKLRAAKSGPVEEDSQTRDSTSARTSTPEMRKTPEKTDSAKKH